jgi:hypothetical protein
MKRILATGIAVVIAFAGGMAVRAASGTPEIATADATIQVSGQLHHIICPGEDGTGYITYSGIWKGGETDVLPAGDPGYTLSGTLTIGGIHWTIDTTTKRGVLTARISLAATATTTEYVGKMTLITQGLPAAGAAVPGRGWIVAAFTPPDEGVTKGDDNLVANVEFALNLGGANGQFGDSAGGGGLNFKDYSAITNVAPAALDGTC